MANVNVELEFVELADNRDGVISAGESFQVGVLFVPDTDNTAVIGGGIDLEFDSNLLTANRIIYNDDFNDSSRNSGQEPIDTSSNGELNEIGAYHNDSPLPGEQPSGDVIPAPDSNSLFSVEFTAQDDLNVDQFSLTSNQAEDEQGIIFTQGVVEGQQGSGPTLSDEQASVAESVTYGDLTINVDGSTSSPTVTVNDISLAEGNEGNTEFSFIVSLSEASEQTVTVDYATADDRAVAGEDYTATDGTLTFEPGETEKTITVQVIGDADVEEDETFNLNLSNGTNAAIADDRGIATITNDDELELQTIELFRFRNTTFETGTYIFVNQEEREAIEADPNLNEIFELEGVQEDGSINSAFIASATPEENLEPLYRFQSNLTPGTFVFVREPERQSIRENFAEEFTEEGLAFYVRGAGTGLGTEFTRFQNNQNDTFLFAGPGETEAIENNPSFSSIFDNQGVAFESLA